MFVRSNWHFPPKEKFFFFIKTECSVRRMLVEYFYFLFLLWKLSSQTCAGLKSHTREADSTAVVHKGKDLVR